jgi:hypothetical protein
MFIPLLLIAYIITPVSLIWGWIRWGRTPKSETISSILSMVGLILATCSAILAVSSVAYANVHAFRFYDPLLMKIFKWGILLSAVGFFIGVGGIWRKNSLRWHSPLSSLGMLVFWVLAAAGE